jgi:YD repeat-containing protein
VLDPRVRLRRQPQQPHRSDGHGGRRALRHRRHDHHRPADYTYDSADRLITATHAGTTAKAVYDAFGRRTTGTEGTIIGYFTGEQIRQITKDSARQTFGLDAANRKATVTAETRATDGTWSTASMTTHHYRSGSDTPAWSSAMAGTTTTVSRNVGDMANGLAAVTSASDDTVLQLSNLHGEVSIQLPLAAGSQPLVQRFDEYRP